MPDPAIAPDPQTNVVRPPGWRPSVQDIMDASNRLERQRQGEVVDEGLLNNPDKAARASRIGTVTGNDPKAVLANPDIEQNHRSELAKRLIETDPFLSQYVKSDPMAASVSNDDWGTLAKYSNKLKELFPERVRFRAGQWWEHFGPTPYLAMKGRQWDYEMQALADVRDFMWEGAKGVAYSLPHALGYGALTPESEAAIANKLEQHRAKGWNEEKIKQSEALWRSHYRQSEAMWGLMPMVFGAVPGAGIMTLAGGFAIPTAIPGAVRGLVARPLEEATGIPKETSEHYINMALMGAGLVHGVYLHNIKIPMQDLEVLGGRMKAIDKYIEQGKLPPTGAEAIMDRLKARAALEGERRRKEAESLAQQSTTRDRAPDIFAKLHADNPNAGPFRISPDAIAHLSDGEKLKLSEAIPDLQLQLRNSEYTGADIEVPVGKWNAHYYPEVAEKLHEHIRLGPDEMTIAEAKKFEEVTKKADEEDIKTGLPITYYRSLAEDIQGKLPPVPYGHTRLWRGNRADEVGVNPAFSSDLPGVALPFRSEYGGPVTYVDVPTGLLEGYKSGAGATDVEYLLPKEFYSQAKIAEHEPTLMDAMRRAAGLHNVPIVELPEGAKPIFEKGALGLPKPIYDRVIKQRAKQVKEDQEFDRRQAEARVRREKTKQWQEDEKEVREQVWEDLAHDPFWAISNFFHGGVMPDGTKVPPGALPKIGREYLTPAQRASMPHLERRTAPKGKGIDPDDIAGMFGYKTGVELVDDLIKLEMMRGKEGPKEFFERRVRMETKRRMEQRFGTLPDIVEREVQDHISGGTPLEALEERLYAAASAAGHEGLPFSLADMQKFAAEEVGAKVVTDRLFDDFLADSGKAYNRFVDAASKGDWTEALKAAQQHYMAMLRMREAKLVQKTQKQFGTIHHRYAQQREVKGVPHLFTAHVHSIMERLGIRTSRGREDIQRTLEGYGENANLQKFYESRNYDENGDPFGLPKGWKEDEIDVLPNMPVWDQLRTDPSWTKPMNELTVNELRAVTETLMALDHVGRSEDTVMVAGRAMDLKRTIDGLVEQMETHKDRPGKAGTIRTHLRAGFAGLTPTEHFFNRVDWDNPNGVFTRTIWTPIIRAANNIKTLQREFSKHFARIMAPDRGVNLNEKIPNNILYEPQAMRPDPTTGLFTRPKTGAQYRVVTRRQMRVVALNWGTESNRNKFIRGAGLDVETHGPLLDKWLEANMTERDWQYVKDVWDMYEEIGRLEDRMMMELAGIPVRKIPGRNFKLTSGPLAGQEIQGKYYPLNYDRSVGFGPTDKMLEQNYNIRAMTSTGHEKERTGYIGPLSLDDAHMVNSVGKRLHNIAMRNVVVETGKIFNNEYFKRVMTDKFGKEWTDLLPTYLRDIAGQNGMMGPKWRWLNDWVEYFRVNIVGSLINYQPSTPGKHAPTAYVHSWREVGAEHFLKAQRDLYLADRDTIEANDNFIMKGGRVGHLDWKGSEELQNRVHMWEETLAGAHEIGMGAPLTWKDVYSRGATMGDFMKYARQANMRMGASVVARTDLVSAKIVWLAQYRKSMDEFASKGIDIEEMHTSAVDMADRAVRRAHGSTHLVNRPELLRGNNPIARTATSLYSFFNSTLMRSWRIFWKSRQIFDQVGAENTPRPELAMEVGKDIVSYWILPIIFEQMITPLARPDEDTPITMKALQYGLGGAVHLTAGQIPILREMVHGAITGHEPTFGVLGTAYKPFTELTKYFMKHPDAYHGGELIEALIGVSSIMFGSIPIPGFPTIPASQQIGKWARGAYNQIMDYEPAPSDAAEWYRLFRRGSIIPPRH